jgi:preprotein translocase subunit SecA
MTELALPALASTAAYPERRDERPGGVDRWVERVSAVPQRWFAARAVSNEAIVQAVHAAALDVHHLSDEALAPAAVEAGTALRREGFSVAASGRAFALVQEAAQRSLGLRHFDVQLQGGWVMLNGMIAEMGTGEGKTLTATLTACTAAFAGMPVHIITVNDYLCTRDAQWMRPLYALLGLSVGTVVGGQSPEVRRAAYACDITYCTNKDLTFDYLRDRLALGPRAGRAQLAVQRLNGTHSRVKNLVLRGLHFAIVDEADSVLVDEARTPLIISAANTDVPQLQLHEAALALAGSLRPEVDFAVDAREQQVQLNPTGRAQLAASAAAAAAGLPSPLRGERRREALVTQALTALHVFQRDVHYLVREDKVQIVDEATGRILPDRSWEHGLHQLVELKEGCTPSAEQTSVGRMTYQRFFRRYLRLGGMTGTAREIGPELWNTYGLSVVPVAPHRPSQRRDAGATVCATMHGKWQAVTQQVRILHASGRPVLVGTRSVAASEALSACLTEAGLPHQLLNARHDQTEADIIGRAGQPGSITVATNMAGRGTDIVLGEGVAAAGGLHVICTELHDSRRVDRQLFGRCARQGDPGSFEEILSLDDELCQKHMDALGRTMLRRWLGNDQQTTSPLLRSVLRRAQQGVERQHAGIRRDLLRLDEQFGELMAFSGKSE